MKYRNVSGHADDDADGRLFEAGGFLDLDEDQVKQPSNAEKIALGYWIPVDETPAEDAPPQPTRAELNQRAGDLNITGRSKMTNDELHSAIILAEQEQKDQEGDG